MQISIVTKICTAGLTFSLIFTGCAKSTTERLKEKPNDILTVTNTNSSPLFSDGKTPTNLPIALTTNSNVVRDPSKPLKRTGEDNSEILATYDGAGTLFEERYFQSSNKMHLVVVETKNDGTKSGRAYARDGKVADLPANLISNAMNSTADNLAFQLGFKEFKSPKTIEAETSVSQMPQTQIAPVPQKIVSPETAPAAETTKSVNLPEIENKPQTNFPQSAKSNIKPTEKQP